MDGGPVALEFDPTGRHLAVCTVGGFGNDIYRLNVWNAGDGALLIAQQVEGCGFAFRPDGAAIAFSTFERGSGIVVAELPGTGRTRIPWRGDLHGLAFDTTAGLLALSGSWDEGPDVVVPADRRVLRHFPAREATEWRFVEAGAAVTIRDAERRRISIVDWRDGREIAALDDSPMRHLERRDGRWLEILRERNALRVRDLADGRLVFQAPGSATTATVRADTRYVAIAGQTEVQTWDVRSRATVSSIAAANVRALAFSPDGRFLAIATGGTRTSIAVTRWHVRDLLNEACALLAVNARSTIAALRPPAEELRAACAR
jgi:dipeptidyl aminopeptidase/acylaminoacyl peptidase